MTDQYLQPLWNRTEASKAYILINLIQGSESQFIKTVKALGSLKKAYCCYGIHDLILEVEANSHDALKALIHKYRKMKDVQSILTLLVTPTISEENLTADKKKIEITI